MARKRTKEEALERLVEASQMAPKGLKGRPKFVRDAAVLGAAGLIMLDPLNRLADERIVLPLDMVCIPAYQAYMIEGTPSLQIYVRAGETIIPTGGNVKDVEEALELGGDVLTGTNPRGGEEATMRLRKATLSKYQKRYKANFNKIAKDYKLKSGKWKKGGFKAAVKKAHAMSRK